MIKGEVVGKGGAGGEVVGEGDEVVGEGDEVVGEGGAGGAGVAAGAVDSEQEPTPDEGRPGKDAPQAKPEKQKGPPQAYTLKRPEGFSEDSEQAVADISRQLGLTNEQAQEMIDTVHPIMDAHLQKKVAAWQKAAREHPEFGGEKFDENLAIANRAVEAFVSPRLLEIMKSSGYANHPEVIDLFWRIGQAIGDDGVVRGNKPVAGKSYADILYGSD